MKTLYEQFMGGYRCRCMTVPVTRPDPRGTVTIFDETGKRLPAPEPIESFERVSYSYTTNTVNPIDPEQIEKAFKAAAEAVEKRMIFAAILGDRADRYDVDMNPPKAEPEPPADVCTLEHMQAAYRYGLRQFREPFKNYPPTFYPFGD